MADTPVFELRTYHAAPGRLTALETRFRDHTTALFRKHDIELVGFWRPLDEPESDNVLIYLLRYPSRPIADERWKAFQSDPEWIEVKRRSEVDGVLAQHIDSVFMEATDFSPMT